VELILEKLSFKSLISVRKSLRLQQIGKRKCFGRRTGLRRVRTKPQFPVSFEATYPSLSTGLLKGDSTFRPQDALTRGDLAHAIAVLQTRAIQ